MRPQIPPGIGHGCVSERRRPENIKCCQCTWISKYQTVQMQIYKRVLVSLLGFILICSPVVVRPTPWGRCRESYVCDGLSWYHPNEKKQAKRVREHCGRRRAADERGSIHWLLFRSGAARHRTCSMSKIRSEREWETPIMHVTKSVWYIQNSYTFSTSHAHKKNKLLIYTTPWAYLAPHQFLLRIRFK